MSDAAKTNESIYWAALAGLLHDVGKFAQRADVGKRELTDAESLDEVRYAHALHSDSFVHECVPPALRGHLTAPRRHHRPQFDQDYQVQLADWLSSGERDEVQSDQRVPFLLSPFARLQEHKATAYLPLRRLDPDNLDIFAAPGQPADWRDEYRDQYKALWDEFTAACTALPDENLFVYLESLYGLLLEFTWCIPSAWYNAEPDVSLYDHARTTAALAACLAADGRDAVWCRTVTAALGQKQAAGTAPQEICLLVGGDLNGVQSFIYTLSSAGTAKSLRARSFYLQLLTDAMVRYLLDELGLPLTNVLYAGGGGFQLLAPISAAARLETARAEISRRLLDIHSADLGLTLAWTPVQAGEFVEFKAPRARLGRLIGQAKRRPFAHLDAETLARQVGVALPFDPGGSPESACAVCGAPDPEMDKKCAFCDSLEQLGRRLPRATHLLAFSVTPMQAGRAHHWQEGLRALGLDVCVVNAADRPSLSEETSVPRDARLARVWRLGAENKHDAAVRTQLGSLPQVWAYRPFAQLTPRRWNKETGQVEIATFDDLADESAQGIRRWGVLRADVDNLGSLFVDGFERPTLSRTASLSLALQLFFEGYVPTIGKRWNCFGPAWEQKERPAPQLWQDGLRDKLYVQYAGGDDLFLVGAWDALPEFAARLRAEFARYACHNPALTLSVGIALADAKFPLYQAARWAGEAEEAAKAFARPDGRGKDAITFLDQTVGWEQFAGVQEQTHKLAWWCSSNNGQPPQAPMALIQTFSAIYSEYERGRKAWQEEQQRKAHQERDTKQFFWGRWMWMLAYRLRRIVNRLPDDISHELKMWEPDLLQDNSVQLPIRPIILIGLVARWAQFLIRKQS
ncbi:MAG: type III-A CRISPR-associated protein Cas10/Csm1 [Anaerolineae bacterium]|nr:type III-A CRISPR-associated protein Cas10/Csm1 [Anaerolineae bacterium]